MSAAVAASERIDAGVGLSKGAGARHIKQAALDARRVSTSRHVAKGGSEGADEPPFFSDQKKIADGVRVNVLRLAAVRFPGAIAPACTAVGLSKHDPEPNLGSVAV